jgi:hypothetical protein
MATKARSRNVTILSAINKDRECYEEIFKLALARLRPEGNRHLEFAVKEFLKIHAEALQEPPEEVIAYIESPEARERLLEDIRAEIELLAANRAAKIAEASKDLAVRGLLLAVSEYENVDPDGNWAINSHLLAVVPSRPKVNRAFEAARAVVDETDVATLHAISEGRFSAALAAQIKQHDDIGRFLEDLAGFLVNATEEKRLEARQICREHDLAKRAAEFIRAQQPWNNLVALAVDCTSTTIQ